MSSVQRLTRTRRFCVRTLNSVVAPVPADNAGRNRLVINLLLVATFVVILNETLMAVALPRLMHDLNVTADAVQWLTTAFLLTMSVIIPVTGFLLQRINTRPVFILAMSLFSLGTLIATVAANLEVLVLARIIQASGTAIMMPLLMTTVMTLAPPETRGKTMGFITTVISVAPAVGPTISGIILNYLSWRWMFLLVLPIALGALALGARRMQNVTTPHHAALDGISVVLSGLAFGGIVYGVWAVPCCWPYSSCGRFRCRNRATRCLTCVPSPRATSRCRCCSWRA
jgi:DHA2 family lincomycin resistance protein-like MFS transporter